MRRASSAGSLRRGARLVRRLAGGAAAFALALAVVFVRRPSLAAPTPSRPWRLRDLHRLVGLPPSRPALPSRPCGAFAGFSAFALAAGFAAGGAGAPARGRRPARSALRLGRRRPRRRASSGRVLVGRGAEHAGDGVGTLAVGPRWAAASYRRIEPATAALSDSIRPCIGIRTRRSQRRRTAGPRPWPSLPDDDHDRPAQVRLAGGERRVPVGADDPQPTRVEVRERARRGRRPGRAGGARRRPPMP